MFTTGFIFFSSVQSPSPLPSFYCIFLTFSPFPLSFIFSLILFYPFPLPLFSSVQVPFPSFSHYLLPIVPSPLFFSPTFFFTHSSSFPVFSPTSFTFSFLLSTFLLPTFSFLLYLSLLPFYHSLVVPCFLSHLCTSFVLSNYFLSITAFTLVHIIPLSLLLHPLFPFLPSITLLFLFLPPHSELSLFFSLPTTFFLSRFSP